MAIINDAIPEMEKHMDPESVRRARAKAEREILAIRLASLRERRGVKQTDMGAFSQTAISKLERRKDMKISTLIDYIESLGMGLEITVFPRDEDGNGETLLKV